MTRKSAYRLGMPGDFRPGEIIPLKGLNFQVAHVERGVLILELKSFSGRGLEALARIQAQMQAEELKEISKDMMV